MQNIPILLQGVLLNIHSPGNVEWNELFLQMNFQWLLHTLDLREPPQFSSTDFKDSACIQLWNENQETYKLEQIYGTGVILRGESTAKLVCDSGFWLRQDCEVAP